MLVLPSVSLWVSGCSEHDSNILEVTTWSTDRCNFKNSCRLDEMLVFFFFLSTEKLWLFSKGRKRHSNHYTQATILKWRLASLFNHRSHSFISMTQSNLKTCFCENWKIKIEPREKVKRSSGSSGGEQKNKGKTATHRAFFALLIKQIQFTMLTLVLRKREEKMYLRHVLFF